MYSSITERRNEKDIDISKRYFSAQRKAAIHYNAIDSLFYEDQGDLGSLGVNPHDMKFGNVQKIQTVGVIDFSNLDSPDYNCVKIWLCLKKKTNGVYPEQRESRIDDYMDYVEVIGANGNTDISGDTLVAVVPVDNNTPVSSESVYIDLGVKTGDEIEGLSGIQYANYRVFLRMELGKITNGEYETVLEVADPDNDYIVYTNAKLLPDFIRVN